MRGHIWLGLLSFPLILFHGGFHFGGALTYALMILFIVVVVSGIVGRPPAAGAAPADAHPGAAGDGLRADRLGGGAAAAQKSDGWSPRPAGPLPVGHGAVADDGGRAAALTSARASRARAPGARRWRWRRCRRADLLRETYLRDIRPFLDPATPPNGVLGTSSRAATLFRNLRTDAAPAAAGHASPSWRPSVTSGGSSPTRSGCTTWLHGWLLVHVPLSMALLLLLGAVHAVIALRY